MPGLLFLRYYGTVLQGGGQVAVVLAATHHEPQGRLDTTAQRWLPTLSEYYAAMVVVITPDTPSGTREMFAAAGVQVVSGAADWPVGHRYLGLWRRAAVEAALRVAPAAGFIHFCDFDRLLHWVEYHGDELAQTIERITAYDFTVLGRTPRAFATHARVQRDTEAIINDVFATVSGRSWDVTAAARGLSYRAAALLGAECGDESIGTDCSWPLFMLGRPGFTTGYLAVEGLEFETPDRFGPEIAAAGGLAAWLNRIDGDAGQWAYRLDLARVEVEAIAAYQRVKEST